MIQIKRGGDKINEGILEEIEVIPTGKIKCFITGKLRKDTKEEVIRQEMARILIEEYEYKKSDIELEFTIKMGRASKRADIVVFQKNKNHLTKNKELINYEVMSQHLLIVNLQFGLVMRN